MPQSTGGPTFLIAKRAKGKKKAAGPPPYAVWLQSVTTLLATIDTNLKAQTATPTYPRPTPPTYQDASGKPIPVLNSLASILASLQSFKNCDSGEQSTGFPSSSDNYRLMLLYMVEILLEFQRKSNADGSYSGVWTPPRYDTTQSAAPAMPHPDYTKNSAPNYNNDNWYRFASLYAQQLMVEGNKKKPTATVETRPVDSGGNKVFDDFEVIEYCLTELTKICDKTNTTEGKSLDS